MDETDETDGDPPDDRRTLPLSDADVRGVVRLLGTLAGSAAPLADRRRELIGGVAALVDAQTWIWVGTRGLGTEHPVPLFLLDGGWADDAERTLVWRANTHPELLAAVSVGVDYARHTTFCWDRSHPGWGDGSAHDRHVRPTGLEHLLLSIYPLGDGRISGVGVHRRAGGRPFAARDRALVHLVVGQVDWLHREGTDVPANRDAPVPLTPRQREVLVHLLGGDGRKRIAAKLGLAPDTVAGYVKEVYRQFGVGSHPELLARFLPAGASAPPSPPSRG